VRAFSRSLAAAWGKYNIRVNVAIPAITSPMYSEYLRRLSPQGLEDHKRDLAKRISLGGALGDPNLDFAPVMVFLASDASRFISAQMIAINGGGGQVR